MALDTGPASSRQVLLRGLLRNLRGVRRHLGFANVVAWLALVIALGGTAVASVLITSNSQVAAHTIAGANAPSGDNRNLIGGSVGTSDLHNGAVSPAKLAANSRAHKIEFLAVGTTLSNTTLLQLDELTFWAQCYPDLGAHTVLLYLRITSSVNGDVNYGYIDEFDGGSTSPVAGGTALAAGEPFYLPDLYSYGAAHRFVGQFVYRNASRVISVTFLAAAYYDGNYFCEVTGTAVPASTN